MFIILIDSPLYLYNNGLLMLFIVNRKILIASKKKTAKSIYEKTVQNIKQCEHILHILE